MATNAQGTRPSSRPTDQTTVTETTNTAGVTPTGVGGVSVYDRDMDGTTDTTRRPVGSMVDDRVPAPARSVGSGLTWIISAIVLIVLVYFLLQMIF